MVPKIKKMEFYLVMTTIGEEDDTLSLHKAYKNLFLKKYKKMVCIQVSDNNN